MWDGKKSLAVVLLSGGIQQSGVYDGSSMLQHNVLYQRQSQPVAAGAFRELHRFHPQQLIEAVTRA
jgi:hypothetical protein